MIEQIVEYNKKFVENKGYEPYLTSKYPNKKLAVLTCMDTRLTELLPAALGLKNGDAKIIKNAGESLHIHTEVWSEAFWLPFWSLVWSRLWSLDIRIAVCREWMEMNC